MINVIIKIRFTKYFYAARKNLMFAICKNSSKCPKTKVAIRKRIVRISDDLHMKCRTVEIENNEQYNDDY